MTDAPEIHQTFFGAMVRHGRHFQYIDIGDGVAVYRLSGTSEAKGASKIFDSLKDQSWSGEGICSLSDAQKISRGKKASPSSFKERLGHWYLATDSELDMIRNHGFDERAVDENNKTALSSIDEGSLFERASNMNTTKVTLIAINFGNHEVLDVHENLLPCVVHYSYISGGMHEKHFNLEKVLEKLRKNANVEFTLHEKRSWHKDESADVIQSIPYYNNNEEHTCHLSFSFKPTKKDMLAITKWMKANPKKRRSNTVAIAHLDLLGIEKYRLDADTRDYY